MPHEMYLTKCKICNKPNLTYFRYGVKENYSKCECKKLNKNIMNIEEQIKKLGFEKQPPHEAMMFVKNCFLYKRGDLWLTNYNYTKKNKVQDLISIFYISKNKRFQGAIRSEMFEDLEFVEKELQDFIND